MVLRRNLRRWTEKVGVDPILNRVTPLRDCREAFPRSFADVIANADDQIDLAQSALVCLCCELPKPLAVHVQADCGRRIEILDNRGKLKKIVHMDDVVF